MVYDCSENRTIKKGKIMKDRRKRKVHRGRRKPNRFVTWFKGLSKKKKIAIYVGGAVLLLLLIVGIFVISKFKKIQTADFNENDINPEGYPKYNNCSTIIVS